MREPRGNAESGFDYSLIICTHNRAWRLPECLNRAAESICEGLKIEMVVVDNASTDETPAVITEFIAQWPHLTVRPIREERVGLSHARNAGIAAAAGDLLVFTDDDCYLDHDYFRRLAQARQDFDFNYFSGNILIYKEVDGQLGGYLNEDAIRNIPPLVIQVPGRLQGSNMGYEREVLARIGKFNTLIGAGTPYRFEDIEYATRASLAGFRGIHLPQVVVRHDHGRRTGSPELLDAYRENSIAGGAYCLESIILGGPRGVLYWLGHWSRLLRGYDGGFWQLRWEMYGMWTYLFYLLRHRFVPRLRID